jgi:uncharacterized protein (TIGR03067 family)
MKFRPPSLRNLFCLALVLLFPQQVRAEDADNDAKSILGHWQVIHSTYLGEPLKEDVGSVYTFKADGTLQISHAEFEATFEYRLDARAMPRTLISFFSNPKLAGSGIYRLAGDKLVWRESDDEQRLSFATPPAGKWNEVTLERLDDKAYEAAAKAVKAKRGK